MKILCLLLLLPSMLHASQGDVRELLKTISGSCNGPVVDTETPEYRDVVWRLWSGVEEHCIKYLNSHPLAGTEELAKQLKDLGVAGSVIQLNGSRSPSFVIAPQSCSGGTFSVIARTAQRYEVAWKMRDLATKHFDSKDDLGHWAYLVNGYHDGPLSGDVVLLPSDSKGNPRFYVEAVTLPGMGLEAPGQISIWRWNGHEAECLFIRTYADHPDSHKVTFQNHEITISVREEYKTFFNCGSCDPGPQTIWKLRITSDGVEDLGNHPEFPSFRAVDNLLYRILHHQDATDLAAPDVIRQLIDEVGDKETFVGMGMPSEIHRGNETVVRLVTDDFSGEFSMIQKNGHWFVSGIKIDEIE